ncbi:MAG: tRNA-dihydrouridine synthase family protein [Candidatus Margulisiibacteriota bacterium]|nr:MAG: hypothetical protein A2X43_13105 [Candidatus Margulisbacteria bacterium GWD2_39_127]OGI04414.1 MAG: hypothetical protein A2X42_08670 [Candidatus Margulisbacteria bacterium GWF2_38_17]OGI07348.1 MAG: hypothetical protein A2X41_08635 [Candidatus Margulisbacteria bacterium GWE2_39_32]PZM80080.1 MAG: tRNA-dihydrouridine synthase family protein [Candidatus Margulisiibacteriota bacterium]HAR62849.1 tRNA-dihydrouridine synthase [Candidatus Margulisiibacteriota bacterium]
MKPLLYLAPIQGITESLFRNIFPKYFKGFDLAIAPFIATSHSNKLRGVVARELDPKNNYGIKTIPQILSKNAQDFISLANSLSELGYDVINWNLGCPFPVVVKKGKGSGMLPHPDQIDSFLEKVIPDIKSKISVKLRLGLYSSEEILQIIPILNRYPLHEIIIHPRTGKQMYKGVVDLDAFETCLALSKHSVVYNGDIDSSSTFQKFSGRFNTVNKWMLGRGALANPFLPEEIQTKTIHTNNEKLEILCNFHNELFDGYSKILSGPAHLTDKMKEIWSFLGNCFEDSKTIQQKIYRIHTTQKYKELINQLFNDELKLKK